MAGRTGGSLGPVVLEEAGLRLVFERRGDRYRHAVAVVDDATWLPVVESVEGTSEDEWPSSPPLEELHLEPGPSGRNVALLVGRSGRAHWSASAEIFVLSTDDSIAARITFDVACRAPRPPLWLGSRYATCQGVSLQGVTAIGCIFHAGRRRVRLAMHPDDAGDGALSAESEAVRLAPPPSTGPWPATLRWRYQFQLLPK